jgi:hypothetical protein
MVTGPAFRTGSQPLPVAAAAAVATGGEGEERQYAGTPRRVLPRRAWRRRRQGEVAVVVVGWVGFGKWKGEEGKQGGGRRVGNIRGCACLRPTATYTISSRIHL